MSNDFSALLSRPQYHEIGGVPVVVLPEGHTTEDLSRVLNQPPRQRYDVTVHTPQSFIDYANEGLPGEGRIYVDERSRTFTVVMNHGTPEQPDWGDHRATYHPEYELEYAAWLNFVKQSQINQVQLIKFLEDRYRDIASMLPAEMLSLVRNFKVASTGSFSSAQNLNNGTIQFHYTAEHRGGGDIEVPEIFILSLPVFEGTDPVEIPVRFRYRLNEGALTFQLEIAAREQLERDEFRKIDAAIRAELKPWQFFRGMAPSR